MLKRHTGSPQPYNGASLRGVATGFVAILLMVFAASACAQTGVRPSGGHHTPREKSTEMPRCPAPSTVAGTVGFTDEQIAKHFSDLRADLALSGEAAALFDAYARSPATFLKDEDRLKHSPRAVTASGLGRIDRMYDEARNRYTALEDLQDSAKKLIAALTTTQRTHADTRLLPLPQTPTETPRLS